jgi:hypothetical protein
MPADYKGKSTKSLKFPVASNMVGCRGWVGGWTGREAGLGLNQFGLRVGVREQFGDRIGLNW